MARAHYRDQALVIRTHDFAEADRVIVLLTREHGVVRAVAKGVRRTRSRFGSRLQPFVLLDVNLYEGRNLATIAEADTVNYFASGLIDNYERYTIGCAALECVAAIVGSGETHTTAFDDLVDTLIRCREAADPLLELDGLLLRVLSDAGWEPSLFACAQCGADGPHHWFSAPSGGAVCDLCRPVGAVSPDPGALRLMWWMAHHQREHVLNLKTTLTTPAEHEYFRNAAASAHALTKAYLRHHLERDFPTLRALDE